MAATFYEMRKVFNERLVPLGCMMFYVTFTAAQQQRQEAQNWWANEGDESYLQRFASIEQVYAHNGFETSEGWWWHEDDAEEQRHGPFGNEQAALVHCLTWQHLLVNHNLQGERFTWREVFTPSLRKARIDKFVIKGK